MAMKVTEVRTAKASEVKKKSATQRTEGPSFADALKEVSGDTPAQEPTDEISGVSGVGAILAAQEVGEDTPGQSKRRLIEHGEDLLDQLEQLKRDILLGGIPKDRLTNLAQRLRVMKDQAGDPRLIRVIEEIELRAEVEIAKYTRRI